MPIYEYRCQKCGKITELYYPKLDGGPIMIMCDHCLESLAGKVISTVGHAKKKKGPP